MIINENFKIFLDDFNKKLANLQRRRLKILKDYYKKNKSVSIDKILKKISKF